MLKDEGTIIIDPEAWLEVTRECYNNLDQSTKGFYKVINSEEVQQMTDIIGKLSYKTEETEETIGSNGKKKKKPQIERIIEDLVNNMSQNEKRDLWNNMSKFENICRYCASAMLIADFDFQKQNNLNYFLNQYVNYNAGNHVRTTMHSLNKWKEPTIEFGTLPIFGGKKCRYIITTKDANRSQADQKRTYRRKNKLGYETAFKA